MKTRSVLVGLTLSFIGGWSAAAVEVRFIEPGKFSDVRDEDFRVREDLLAGIQAHFRAAAEKALPGKDLSVEVTDVDLAGRLQPRWRQPGVMLRVLRDGLDGPMIELRYVLSEGGAELRRGEAQLRDTGYMDRINHYDESDPLRYEKRMIDDWIKQEFAPAAAPK